MEKLSSVKLVSGAKKFRDCCCSDLGAVVHLESMEILCSFPIPCPVYLLHLLLLSYILLK